MRAKRVSLAVAVLFFVATICSVYAALPYHGCDMENCGGNCWCQGELDELTMCEFRCWDGLDWNYCAGPGECYDR